MAIDADEGPSTGVVARQPSLVGRSAAMRHVLLALERAACTDATVLLAGETGTGKEVAASTIHARSPRRDGPFVVVDCGSIPSELIESELFGHERGSFTGALGRRLGAFEAAAGGTVLLDEIGELPLEMQPKLLRVVETRTVRRVGASTAVPIDVRIVAATHRTLSDEVEAGRFRADLFYRLAVLEVRLPALRSRVEDLPLLLAAFTARLATRLSPLEIDDATWTMLAEHRWPGNVRELRNYVERCAAYGEWLPLGGDRPPRDGLCAQPPTMPRSPSVDVTQSFRAQRDACVRAFERHYLGALMEAHAGNVRQAARAAAIDRVQLYRLLWRHGIRPAPTARAGTLDRDRGSTERVEAQAEATLGTRARLGQGG